MIRNLPHKCPSCEARLKVSALTCEVCETVVSGRFELPQLAQLTRNEQEFILDFVRSSGSLKEMAQKLGLSYPTVRNLLDDIIIKLNTNE
ncbi:hypothetical protein DYBT9275_05228 [Dyadobacter sp. CECT 9275]|uniref:DUF2089 domain-containing protein n=1 Tax=Dyadobacter helix TaxID=2822344 RepID=A0A916JJ57_9BACT|nr:DUF2089 family protein [Dyadobacter sp. CECT 9275]CAG5012692.1 hypothetical protein DYBT9275_05228 [Dyadobacter sp. CECT 9275]